MLSVAVRTNRTRHPAGALRWITMRSAGERTHATIVAGGSRLGGGVGMHNGCQWWRSRAVRHMPPRIRIVRAATTDRILIGDVKCVFLTSRLEFYDTRFVLPAKHSAFRPIEPYLGAPYNSTYGHTAVTSRGGSSIATIHVRTRSPRRLSPGALGARRHRSGHCEWYENVELFPDGTQQQPQPRVRGGI